MPERGRRVASNRDGEAGEEASGVGEGTELDSTTPDASSAEGSARAPRRWLRRLRRIVLSLLATIVVLVLALVIAFQVSYWPTTVLLRHMPTFNGGDPGTEQVDPPTGVQSTFDLVYREGDPDGRMDVFSPEGVTGQLPTVVWVHGGAFVAGTKEGTTTYLQLLAAEGYTTISVEYTKAPEQHYPYQVNQVADALAYIDAHAEELGVDSSRIVLGGDSAGGHIAAQTAMAVSEPEYAEAAGLPAPIGADQLVGTVLMCGAYDLFLPDYGDGVMGRFQRDIIWAYTGEKHFLEDSRLAYASLPQHVTDAYPPTFISAGNGDPLEPHSHSMAEALRAADVPTDELFFPPGTEPEIPHEYQFQLAQEPAQEAFDRVVDFLETHTQEQ